MVLGQEEAIAQAHIARAGDSDFAARCAPPCLMILAHSRPFEFSKP